MRNRQDDFRRDDDREPRWLHGHHHGQSSDRGNYTIDSHFNQGYGNYDVDWTDDTSFNSGPDQEMMSRQGRFGVGGAHYSGPDYTRDNRNSDNPYGMTYTRRHNYNSYRHYDPRADYSNSDYSDRRGTSKSREPYGMEDERFGHDVRRGGDNENWARGSVGDIESYRRYEQYDRNYDNDYSGGFAGRNYSPGQVHYGEGSHYSNLDRWNSQNTSNQQRGGYSQEDRDNYRG